jgi:hypothetical protein
MSVDAKIQAEIEFAQANPGLTFETFCQRCESLGISDQVRKVVGGYEDDPLWEEMEDSVWFDNSILKPEYHNKRDGGRTFSSLRKLLGGKKKKEKPVSHEAEIARRVEVYASQVEASGEIEFLPMVENPPERNALKKGRKSARVI